MALTSSDSGLIVNNSTLREYISTMANDSDVTRQTTTIDHEMFYQTSQFVTGLILYPVICIPGFLANILTLIVLSQKNMLTSTNAFLSALAVSDAVKLANDIIYFLVIVLMRTNPTVANKAFGYVYPYAHFIFNASTCVSSWLTVSVAAERYIMVCHPARSRSICSRKRSIITSMFVFIIMTGMALPSALRYKTVTVTNPKSNETTYNVNLTDLWKQQTFVKSYTWIIHLLRCIIPLFILIVLNFCIINALRKTRANKKLSSRNRVTFMLIMVIVVFLLGITPDAVLSTFLGFGYHEANLLVKGIREFTDTLLAVSAAGQGQEEQKDRDGKH
ncbi:hypothetical protein CHS0354_026933 [Potamilus streckersoni]|uniref:G-protein coupled receptors family 1 profile domain-containing protein n=1 Tax=Potamilus streckersoni TaxID=2493646 RepID=A0AAE0SM28_9BIVA|nr:hypothetical protein CHS0354_026933 [Potamilus streckersoni]